MATEKKARGGARGKLRAHFLENIGRVMDSDELRVVAENQSEWARRVRELRTEEGYQILTHNDRSELKPGQYLLETPKPQPAFERAISKETRAFVLDRNGFTQCAGSPGVQPGVESADGAAVLRGGCAAVPNCARFGSASIE